MTALTRLEILGQEYIFDASRSQVLKWGLFLPYHLADEGGQWVILDEYIFWSHRIQHPLIVPRWFWTDLASIPQWCRSLISVNDRHWLAALPHDLAYVLQALGKNSFSRSEIDLMLRDFCKVAGVEWWKRNAMYYAVRAGGWMWFNHTGKEMYIPSSHRFWYKDTYPHLNLDLSDGAYLPIMKNH